MNVGNGTKRARWAVYRSEIDAWLERSKKVREKTENAIPNATTKWPNKG